MIEWVSSWAEQIVLAIIIVSILELILPNNKNKKYIKMVLGIYVLFAILSPIFKGSQMVSVEDFTGEQFKNTSMQANINVDQTSMDARLQELYIDALEEDIKSKVEQQGYKVLNCNVTAILDENNPKKGIQKIQMIVDMKDKEGNHGNLQKINSIDVQVGINKYVSQNKENNSKETEKIVELLSSEYELEKTQISITMK